jgi:hypothetical protein
MNTLIVVLISGMAAGYVVELLVAITERWLSSKVLRAIITAPLSVLAAYTFGLTGWMLLVVGLAAAFFALVVINLIIKPEVVQTITRRL